MKNQQMQLIPCWELTLKIFDFIRGETLTFLRFNLSLINTLIDVLKHLVLFYADLFETH